MGRGAHERRRIAGKGARETRRNLVPQEVASQRDIGIRFVVDPCKAARLRIRFDRRARKREKRAQQRAAPRAGLERRHRSEALRPRAAQELQQQRLRLVVGMMPERNEIGIDRLEHAIAGVARRRFEPGALRMFDRDAVHGQRHAALRALRAQNSAHASR